MQYAIAYLEKDGNALDGSKTYRIYLPGKGWNMLLRLYGPLEPWFDKTWRPGNSELVE